MGESISDKVTGLPEAGLRSLFAWLLRLFAPVSIVREGLRNELNDVVSIMSSYWITPVILALATDAMALHFYGIEFKSEPGFTVVYLTFVVLTLVCQAYILFGVLKLMRVSVQASTCFLAYSIVVTYLPLFSWLGILDSIHAYDMLSLLKSHNFSLTKTWSYYMDHAQEIETKLEQPLPLLNPAFAFIASLFSFLSLALVAECIAQLCATPRRCAYIATGTAAMAAFIPAAAYRLAKYALLFGYMGQPQP